MCHVWCGGRGGCAGCAVSGSDHARVAIPAAVADFYEFQDVFCALDLLLLKAHNLHLLFPVFEHPQLGFTIQQVKDLIIHAHSQHQVKLRTQVC